MVLARAAVVAAVGEAPTVEDIDLVEPVDDEVLVAIGASGICHTDLSCASGVLGTSYPVVLGHEGACVVVACGPRTSRFAPGERVVVSVAHHCGHCSYCERGYPPLCVDRFSLRPRYSLRGQPVLQAYGTGTFTSMTVLRERSLAPVPDSVPLTVAAVTGCAVVTGLGAVLTHAKVRPGSTVAVCGCGGVGASMIMGARVSGAARVVAVDPDPDRRRLALEVGADDAVEPDPGVLSELQPLGFDYTFEAAGRTDAMELAVASAAPTGVITVTGLPSGEARLNLPVLEFTIAGKTLIGCNMGSMRPHVDFPAYFDLYSRGRLPLDALVGETLSLEQAADGFERARTARARVLLTTDVEESTC